MATRADETQSDCFHSVQNLGWHCFLSVPCSVQNSPKQLRVKKFPAFIKPSQQSYPSFWTQTIYVFLNNYYSLCLLFVSFYWWTNTENEYSEIKNRVKRIWTEVDSRRKHRHISQKVILQLFTDPLGATRSLNTCTQRHGTYIGK